MNRFKHSLVCTRSNRLLAVIICIALVLPLIFTAPAAALTPLHPIDPGNLPVLFLAPSDLTATAVSSSEINLSWKDNSGNEEKFYVERKEEGQTDFDNLVYLLENTTTFADTGLKANTTYYYRVRAANSSGSTEYSNEASAKTYAVLNIPVFLKAPSDLTATAKSKSKQINLAWTDNTSNELNYNVERKSGSDDYAVIAQLPANAKQYADTTVSYNSTYSYRVQAIGNGGKIKNSPYSNEASASTDSISIIPPLPFDPHLPALTTVMRFYIGNTDYYVNNQLQTMDTAPVINLNRTVLPIKYVATPLGATVDWDGIARKVTITMQGKVIELWINNNTARINGQPTLIDPNNPNVTPIILPPGRTMLPLRFIAESLGSEVIWESTTQEVKITYPK